MNESWTRPWRGSVKFHASSFRRTEVEMEPNSEISIWTVRVGVVKSYL